MDYENKSKEIKERLDTLKQLTAQLDDQKMVDILVLPNLGAVINMIEFNLFRPLPYVQKASDDSADAGVKTKAEPEITWPHIKPVYEFFLKLLGNASTDKVFLFPVITEEFIANFISLSDSSEEDERTINKDILYQLYLKLVKRRKVIRAEMHNHFYTLIHETHKFNGIAKLLDMYASIISGLVPPLKEEYVYFFNNVIISTSQCSKL